MQTKRGIDKKHTTYDKRIYAITRKPENSRLINGGARYLSTSVGQHRVAEGQKADQLRRRVHKPGSKVTVHTTRPEVIESRRACNHSRTRTQLANEIESPQSTSWSCRPSPMRVRYRIRPPNRFRRTPKGNPITHVVQPAQRTRTLSGHTCARGTLRTGRRRVSITNSILNHYAGAVVP